ncbi:MAG: DUF6037 family protein [Bifidobacteriaceae bacterium]|jgi:hypothetical protein|nr:DUF6037 family protein [Bifidobacteriaceae bacterium]
MKLDGIIDLYREMKDAGELRQQFIFEYNSKKARVLFLTDAEPFVLCFSEMHATEPQYFEIEMKQGFVIDTYLQPEVLSRFRDMFDIGANKTGKFSTRDFFECFNKRIPKHVANTGKVRPVDMIQFRRNVEEVDKIYFWRFRNNPEGEHVSSENLEKTQKLIGEEAYNRCSKYNISTQWTGIEKDDNFDSWQQDLEQKVKADI